MGAGASYLGTRQQIQAQANQQRVEIQAQVDQQRDSFLRTERKAAYALLIQTDLAVQEDEKRTMDLLPRRKHPLTPADRRSLVGRDTANQTKLEEAVAQVSVVGTEPAMAMAGRVIEAHIFAARAMEATARVPPDKTVDDAYLGNAMEGSAP